MTIEAPEDITIQVKSRVGRRGPFRTGEVAQHVLNTWAANAKRSRPAHRVWVILENSVDTPETFDDVERTLSDLLPSGSPLLAALQAKARNSSSAVDLAAWLDQTVVLARSWSELDEATDALLERFTDVPLSGRQLVGRSLRIEIANATDANTTLDPVERRRLDRTEVVRHVDEVAEQIDTEGLEAALGHGLCRPLDRTVGTPADDRFYEAVSTQPGHVAAGLVVPRPDLLTEVARGLDGDSAVIITGPSGVGKSALLWTVPEVLPGITWFRVGRLVSYDDANLLARLARAYGASDAHPVGFLVDGLGLGRNTDWASLRAAAALQPGMKLLATARNEDLVSAGDLADVSTVAVTLDEAAAETIFNGLQRAGVAKLPGWREAFDQSAGLTLEFTYLVTQGERLGAVIGDQIRRRVDEERTDELKVLALVSVADQWGAALRVEQLSAIFDHDDGRLRTAIRTLVNEHLVAERDGEIGGLHPVRSAAVAEVIHAVPPPTLGATVTDLLPLISNDQLPRFIANALRDHPDLAVVVIDSGVTSGSAARLAAFLQGLRRADSDAMARQRVDIMADLDVPRSIQVPTVLFTVTGTDFTELDVLPAIRRASDAMRKVPEGHLRDELAERVGPDVLSRLVFSAELDDATELLATLSGWSGLLTLPVGESRFVDQLRHADTGAAGRAFDALRRFDLGLLTEVTAQLGGHEWVLERLRSENPWLLELSVDDDEGGLIGHARLLHVDDSLGSPRDRCVALANTLLQYLPNISRPDVKALLPGGREIEIDGYNFGSSGLLRDHAPDEAQQAWNQTQIISAQALLAVPDTIHLAAAGPIFQKLAKVIHEYGNRWVRDDLGIQATRTLAASLVELSVEGEALPPPLRGGEPSITRPIDLPGIFEVDPLSTAITNSALMIQRIINEDNHRLLAGFVDGHVIKHLRAALERPWHLVEEREEAEDALERLLSDASAIRTILLARARGEEASKEVTRAARKGSARFALKRASDAARKVLDQIQDERRHEVVAAIRAALPDLSIDVYARSQKLFDEFAVLIEGPPLYELVARVDAIQTAVEAAQDELEMFSVLLARDGEWIPSIGWQLVRTWHPLGDVTNWESELPPPRQSDLAGLVGEVVASLQTLSGLADLNDAQRRHPDVVALAGRANELLGSAAEALEGRRGDEFVDHVLDVAETLTARVQAELAGAWEGPTLAAATSAAFLGASSEDGDVLAGLHVLAIEWEIDSDGVRHFLNA